MRRRQQGRPVRWYVYAWRGGPRVKMSIGPLRPRLTQEDLQAILAAHQAERSPDPTTFLSLIRSWRASPEWAALAAGTRKTWGSALDRIEAKWGETPLGLWNDPRMVGKVVAWRDTRAETPRAADIGVTVLRALLEHGRLRGRVSMNVAANIPQLYRNGRRAEIIWTAEDISRFKAAADRLGQAHISDGLDLAALTGLRRADLVTLTWDQVGQFAIVKKALKRSAGKRRHMTMPRIPALNALLEELRSRPRRHGVETVLVNSHGDPWSGDGFGGSFNRIRDAACIVHVDEDTGEQIKKHLHDVRGTFCTLLMTNTELTDREVADIMGWSPERVAGIRKVYVDQSKRLVAIGRRMQHLKLDGH